MQTKKCPRCGLYNTGSAVLCDCGYNFATGQKKPAPVGHISPSPAPSPAATSTGQPFAVRAGAFLIDSVLLNAVSVIVFALVITARAVAKPLAGLPPLTEQQIGQLAWPVGIAQLILFLFYYTLFEGMYGATPGKLLVGVRVVQTNWCPCSLWVAFSRAIYRLFDGLFLGLVAYVVMKPPLYQRLGDKYTDTLVVSAKHPQVPHRAPRRLATATALFLGLVACLTLASLLVIFM